MESSLVERSRETGTPEDPEEDYDDHFNYFNGDHCDLLDQLTQINYFVDYLLLKEYNSDEEFTRTEISSIENFNAEMKKRVGSVEILIFGYGYEINVRRKCVYVSITQKSKKCVQLLDQINTEFNGIADYVGLNTTAYKWLSEKIQQIVDESSRKIEILKKKHMAEQTS